MREKARNVVNFVHTGETRIGFGWSETKIGRPDAIKKI